MFLHILSYYASFVLLIPALHIGNGKAPLKKSFSLTLFIKYMSSFAYMNKSSSYGMLCKKHSIVPELNVGSIFSGMKSL